MPRCEMCDEWPDCPWKTDPEIMCGEYHPKPMTNADRIRSMTDEELARLLCQDRWFMESHALDWLKSPVEVDNG